MPEKKAVPTLPQLVDQVVTARKDRLRILYAVFLAREAGAEAASAQIQRRVGLNDERFSAALQHLAAGGYLATAGDGLGLTLQHAGRVAVEHALVRPDREYGEFPALRSILKPDLSLPRTLDS